MSRIMDFVRNVCRKEKEKHTAEEKEEKEKTVNKTSANTALRGKARPGSISRGGLF